MRKVTLLVAFFVCSVCLSQIESNVNYLGAEPAPNYNQQQNEPQKSTTLSEIMSGDNSRMYSLEEELIAYSNRDRTEEADPINELLERYSNIGIKSGIVSSYFTTEELQILRRHFSSQNRNTMADIIPTAGATETFVVNVGDHFFDPGGPGGSSTGGSPGNYPNCDCDTITTLDGATEVDFQFFSVFATFDYLIIYDSADTSGTVLYDNSSGGANAGDITLADMIASHGSSTFTGTSGSMTFFFHATAVVDYGGWDAEITATGGGGGGTCGSTLPNYTNSLPSGGGPPSQVFSDFPDFDCFAADDFVAPGDGKVCQVDITGSGPAIPVEPTNMVIMNIHEDNAGEPGAVIFTESFLGTDVDADGDGIFTLSPTMTSDLTGGNLYWMSVVLEASFGGSGQWFWLGALDANDGPYLWQNPGGGFGTPCGTWGTGFDCGVGGATGPEDLLMDISFLEAGGGGGGCPPFSVDGPYCNPCSDPGSGNALACSTGPNSIIQGIDMSGLTETVTVNSIEYVQDSQGTGPVTVTVNIFCGPAGANPPPYAGSDTPLYSETYPVDGADDGTCVSLVLAGLPEIDASCDTLWVEILVDTGRIVYTPLVCDGNPGTGLNTWIVAPACGAVDPVLFSDLGFPDRDAGMSATLECVGGGGGGGCATGVYADRGSFDAEAGVLPLEDWDGGPGGITGCDGPFSAAGNSCYAPGEILDGIEVISSNMAQADPVVYVEAGNFGLPDDAVGSNFFVDYTIVNFPNNDVNSFGMDLYGLIGGSTMEVRIFGTGGLITTETVTDVGGAGVFFGYIASETVVSVEIEDLSGVTAELVAQVAFGECSGGGVDNDDCSNATPIACDDTLSGDTSDNTDTNGDGSPDEWFAFTSTTAGELVTVSTCDQAAYDTILTVYDSCGGAVVATNDDGPGCSGFTSELDFVADGSSTYYIAVDGFGGASGTFDLTVTCSAVANDLCENAIPVDCNTSVSGTTINATIDDAVAPTCDTGVTSPGVWYVYEDNSGLAADITITMCSGNGTADYDSKLSVYTGDCGAPPLTCVVGNDDTCGLQSEVSFQSDGATTYLILVHGFGGATGNFTIDINCILVPPPNDDIVNAIEVDLCPLYTDEDVAMPAATTEGGNPVDCDISGANGVWYKFTPDNDGSMTCTIDQPAGTSSVTFYTAPDDNATETDLVLVDYYDNQCVPGTTTTIPVVVGQWYYTFVVNTGGITDITFECDVLGVEDNQIAGFNYYPNPATDMINLSALDTIDNVALYNVLGQKVIDLNVDAISTQVNVSNLSTGTYFMKVSVNGQLGTYKVLKK